MIKSNVALVYKKIGQTPLEAIRELKARDARFRDSKMSYAGRLDPMARGLLIGTQKEKTKNKNNFSSLKGDNLCGFLTGWIFAFFLFFSLSSQFSSG
jgi:tRNA U55 pseudouridine synthase TruB